MLNNKKKAWYVSDLVRNSEDGFSHDASQFVLLISQIPELQKKSNLSIKLVSIFLCDFKMYKSSIMGVHWPSG